MILLRQDKNTNGPHLKECQVKARNGPGVTDRCVFGRVYRVRNDHDSKLLDSELEFKHMNTRSTLHLASALYCSILQCSVVSKRKEKETILILMCRTMLIYFTMMSKTVRISKG